MRGIPLFLPLPHLNASMAAGETFLDGRLSRHLPLLVRRLQVTIFHTGKKSGFFASYDNIPHLYMACRINKKEARSRCKKAVFPQQ